MQIHSDAFEVAVELAVAVYKRRYQIDLAAEQAECEINYARLSRLLRGYVDEHHTFDVGSNSHMHIRIVERCPYTSTLEIAQAPSMIAAFAPRLTVRVYHDARLAEVVAFAPWRRALPRYEYPNPAMHQPNEKSQWNHFLGEWLSHCLQHGFPLDRSLSTFCEL
ncbi:MAG: putative dehydrogenase [Verrucomicrobiaceae bacterium]|nr:putative dehydrogenase [Verrucomicrobiaceae bacterium]